MGLFMHDYRISNISLLFFFNYANFYCLFVCLLFSWLSFHSNIIPGIEAADDKKGNSPKPLSVVTDSKQTVDFDYDDDDDTSSGVKTPKSTIIPYFEHNVKTVYLTGEDNVTLACLPKNFNGKDTK